MKREPSATNESTAAPAPDAPSNSARRRLFRGVAGGTGVLLSVQARTALGGTVCLSPSRQMSGATSPRPGEGPNCSGGRSPGFWKQPQHGAYWGTAGGAFPTFKKDIMICGATSGLKKVSLSDLKTQGLPKLTTLFPGATSIAGVSVPNGGWGIWAVLAFPGSFNQGQLLRHLAAAWLNAGYFTFADRDYPLSQPQVTEMWNAVKGGGTYCPSSMLSCSSSWTANQIISYIEGLYDINSGLEDPELCETA